MNSALAFLTALAAPHVAALPQDALRPLRLEIRPQLDKQQIEPPRRFRQRWFPLTSGGIQAAKIYAALAGQSMGVYASISPRRGDVGTSEAVHHIAALWASVDDNGGDAIALVRAARESFAFALPAPHIALHSGGGVHLVWMLDGDPVDVTEANNRERVLSAVRRISRHINSAANANPAAAETNTAYLSYMVRVPETFNHKRGLRRPVRLLRCVPDAPKHNLTWWRANLPPEPAPKRFYPTPNTVHNGVVATQHPTGEPRPLPADLLSLIAGGAPPETRHKTALTIAGRCFARGYGADAVTLYLEQFAAASGWRVQPKEIPNIVRHCERKSV